MTRAPVVSNQTPVGAPVERAARALCQQACDDCGDTPCVEIGPDKEDCNCWNTAETVLRAASPPAPASTERERAIREALETFLYQDEIGEWKYRFQNWVDITAKVEALIALALLEGTDQ